MRSFQKKSSVTVFLQSLFKDLSAVFEKRIGLVGIWILSMLLIFSAMGRIAFAVDVGILPGAQGCPPGSERIEIYMDDQDDKKNIFGKVTSPNTSSQSGWVGLTGSYKNTTWVFCRIKNAENLFKSWYVPSAPTSVTELIQNQYAVLQLDSSCPNGSLSFYHAFNDENSGNKTRVLMGNIYPNSASGDTVLNFCLFHPSSYFDPLSMSRFPELGIEYGVFAHSTFKGALATGYVYSDGEDNSSLVDNVCSTCSLAYNTGSSEFKNYYSSFYFDGNEAANSIALASGSNYNSNSTVNTAKVRNKPTPQASVESNTTNICKGSSAILTFSAKGGVAPFTVRYNVITGATSPSEVIFGQDGQGVRETDSPLTKQVTVAPNLPTTYRLASVTDKVGNVSNLMGEVTVNVDIPPPVTFTPPNSQCSNGSPIELTGGSPAGGVYSGTGVEFSNGKYSFNPAKAIHGNNIITYTATQGSCTASKEGVILVNKSPDVTLALESNMLDMGGGIYKKSVYATGLPYTLPAPLINNLQSMTGYSWSPYVANAGGDYTVTYTDGNSCSGKATLHLEVESAQSVIMVDGIKYYCINGKPLNEAYTWKLYGVYAGGSTLLTSQKVEEPGVAITEGTTGLITRFIDGVNNKTAPKVTAELYGINESGEGLGCFSISDNDSTSPDYIDFMLWVGDSSAPTCSVTEVACAYNPIIWKVKRQGKCTFPPQNITAQNSFEMGNDGYINNPVSITGKVGNALSFNGSNRVELPSKPELNVGQGDFSLVAWVKTTQANGTILSKEYNQFGSAIKGYSLYFSSGQPGLRLGTGSGSWTCGNTASSSCTNYNSGKTINDGQWHLVAVTIDRDNPNGGKFYVDGAEVLTFDPTLRAGSLDNDGLFKMGQFTGELDEVAVFKRALRDKEIQNIHKADSDGICRIDMTPPITLCPNSVCNVAKTGSDTAGDGSETNPFATIQHGIELAKEGYTVLVQAGMYVENIRFGNKNIIVKSKEGAAKTIIDGHQTESVATFIHDGDIAAGVSATLQGFTLTNGIGTPGNDDTYRTDFYAGSRLGGGILCHKTKPILKDLIITKNSAKNGGGLFGRGCEPTVINTVISKNSASGSGGGVGFVSGWLKSPVFKNVLIAENTAVGNGGGVFVDYSSQAVMINSTVSKNTSGYGRGGAIDRANQSGVNLTNSIVWDNGANPVYLRGTGYTSQISYSIVQTGQSAGQITWGTGSLDIDPQFVGNGDYHLSATSPALGKGTLSVAPTDDLEGKPRPYPIGSNPDMGVYENAPLPTRIISLTGNLAFGDVQGNTTKQLSFTIQNTGNAPLTINSITYPAGFSGNWNGGTIMANGFQDVIVVFTPTVVQLYSGNITVISDKTSGTDTISISGTGTLIPTKIISLSGSLAFGDIATGQTATQTLTIKNTGNSTLTVASILYPAGFSGNWSGTIAAGSFQNVSVTFTPIAPQSYIGVLTVNSDKTAGTDTISISGKGNDPPVTSDSSLSTNSGVSVSGTLNATDDIGDVLTYIVTQPTKGKLTPDPSYPNFKYLPNVGVTGTDTFTFKANDGKADSKVATVTITVNAVGGGTFTRTLPECYTAGVRLTVTLNVAPSSGTINYLIEDVAPDGWTVSNISNSGSYDSFNRKIKWRFQDSTARTLTYDITPPVSETGDKTFTGKAYPDTADINIAGQTVITQCSPYHPADINKDFVLSGNEVSTYSYYWKKGMAWSVEPNPIPMNYVVSAAGLWFEGEKYKLDVTAGACPLCWISDLTRQAVRQEERSSETTVIRQMSAVYKAGQAFTVSITVKPADSVKSYAVEETVPAGWTVAEPIENGGFVDGKVLFGPFTGNQPVTLTYQITPPVNAVGSYQFVGKASVYRSADVAITGISSVSDTALSVAPGDVNGSGGDPDLADAILVLQVLAGINPPDVNVGADVNGDNRIGLEEVVYILQKAAELR